MASKTSFKYSAYYTTLSGDVRARYDEKIRKCGGIDPYTMKSTDLSSDPKEFPKITMSDITDYMINSVSSFTKQFSDNYKGTEAYSFFESGFVLDIGSKNNNNFSIVKGKAPTSLLKELTKCKHPNSRKTLALAKKAKRFNNRSKIKLGHAVKSNILGEKFSWFTEAIGDRTTPLTKPEFDELITIYLKRFDDELEQIHLKQSISKNRSKQHASRLDVIKITLEREVGEYNGAGIELLDLTDAVKFEKFKNWDGNSVNLQHFKLDRICKKYLH